MVDDVSEGVTVLGVSLLIDTSVGTLVWSLVVTCVDCELSVLV